jgi:hypothetical protein
MRCAAAVVVSTSALLFSSCAQSPEKPEIEVEYDERTGRLSRLTINKQSDGKPNIVGDIQESKFVKIEVDSNEDGKTDRWEYYGADEKLSRVGVSRANDGIEDAWVFRADNGAIARIEVSTKRNGKANRTEFYENGVLAKAAEDANLDGLIDKWEQYESGVLVSASFDTTNSGHPTTTVDYRKR